MVLISGRCLSKMLLMNVIAETKYRFRATGKRSLFVDLADHEYDRLTTESNSQFITKSVQLIYALMT